MAGGQGAGPASPPRPIERSAGRARKLVQVVAPAQAGLRLDQFIAAGFPELSRRAARALIDLGGAFVDGRRSKQAGRAVVAGQRVEVVLGGALARARGGRARAAAPPVYSVLFEDDDVVVVDKPAGLLTAPTPEGDRNNLAYLLARRAPGRPSPIFVVHRLDLPTSGVLVFAKSDRANRALGERFRVHDVERRYFAVVEGVFPAGVQRIVRPIAGRDALTLIESREALGEHATLLGLRLHTGRTHQIRIHCKALGHPVLGDPGGRARRVTPRPPRLALHAAVLGLPHPVTGAPLRFESPWPPADLAAWWARLLSR